MHETVTKQIQKDKEDDLGAERMFVLSQKTSGLLVEYFTIASAIIESRSAELLNMKLVGDGRKSKSSLRFFQRNLRQGQREELMYRCGIIDEGFKGSLKDVRRERNNIVHNLDERLYIGEDDETIKNVDKALTAVEDLSTEYFRETYSST